MPTLANRTDADFSKISEKYGLHQTLVDAIDAGNFEDALSCCINNTQAGMLNALAGNYLESLSLLASASEDNAVQEYERSLAGFLKWILSDPVHGESWEDARRSAQGMRNSSLGRTVASRVITELDQEIARLSDQNGGVVEIQSLKLCRCMVNFELGDTRGYLPGLRAIAGNQSVGCRYLRGLAHLMVAAHTSLIPTAGGILQELETSRREARRLLLGSMIAEQSIRQVKEFDSADQTGAVSSTTMKDVDGPTSLAEPEPLSEAELPPARDTCFITVDGVPADEVPTERLIVSYRRLVSLIRLRNGLSDDALNGLDAIFENALLVGNETLSYEEYRLMRNHGSKMLKKTSKDPDPDPVTAIRNIITPLAKTIFGDDIRGRAPDADTLTNLFEKRAARPKKPANHASEKERAAIIKLIREWRKHIGAVEFDGEPITSVHPGGAKGLEYKNPDTGFRTATNYFPKIKFS